MKTRYYTLKFGDKFVTDGDVYQKESWYSAARCFGHRNPLRIGLWPWTRVRIVSEETDPLLLLLARDATRLEAGVAKVFSRSPWLDVLKGGKFPENPGKTHFFGDDCYPPHEISREIYDAFKNLDAHDNRTGPSA